VTLPKLTLQEAVKNSKERIQHLKSQQLLFGSNLSSLIQSETEWLEELEDTLNQQQRNQKKE
jgi:hypothetical protein